MNGLDVVNLTIFKFSIKLLSMFVKKKKKIVLTLLNMLFEYNTSNITSPFYLNSEYLTKIMFIFD